MTERGRVGGVSPLRWGLVGASAIAGEQLIPALREAGATVRAVASRDTDHGRAFAAVHGIAAAYGDATQLLERGDVDAVYVSSVNALHAGQVRLAAQAGKHVLCEKPLTTNLADADAAIAACTAAGVVLAVNHHLREKPVFRIMRALLHSGEIGELRGARLSFTTELPAHLRTWRLHDGPAGGGVVLDLTVHSIDLLRYLTRQEIATVTSLTGHGPGAATEVEAVTALRLDGGVVGVLHESFTTPHGGTAVALNGTRGSLVATDALLPVPAGRLRLRTAAGERDVETGPPRNPYVGVVESFTSAVRSGSRASATGEDGREAVRVALAVLRSAASGRAVRVADTDSGPGLLRLDPEVAAAIAELPADGPPLPRGAWRERRRRFDAATVELNARLRPPGDVDVDEHFAVAADGTRVPLRIYRRRGRPSGALVLYLHGGGHFCCDIDASDPSCRTYASGSGATLISVDYRFAPEHPYPVALEDAYAALCWTAEHARQLGGDPGRLAVMGDSAGGGMAAGLALMARDRDGPALRRQVLVYPMLDDRTAGPDPAIESLLTWSSDDNVTGWWTLLGERAGREDVPAYAAPARASDLTGLPSTYLEVGQLDLFCPEDVDFATRLSRAGVEVELLVRPGVPHDFELLAPRAAVTRRAVADRVRVLSSL